MMKISASKDAEFELYLRFYSRWVLRSFSGCWYFRSGQNAGL